VTLAIGILASGTGTNFDAIAAAIADHRLDAEIRVLICNRPRADVLRKAAARGIATRTIEHRSFATRDAFDVAIANALEDAAVELVVLAGFDRIVTTALLERFPDRVLNIHPALLPAFPGEKAQEQAWRYGVRITGATVHIVDAAVDHGPIVVQAAVAIDPADDLDTVRKRILVEEHRIYPYAIQLFAEGRVRVDGRRVLVDGTPVGASGALISPPLPR
jgi:phosphoribosylglycinamide formyltransferase-1